MNNLTKKITFATTALVATGILAFNQVDEVSAATSWEARTVENVRQDVQKNDDGSKVYTVQQGDTLAVIAQAFEVNVSLLASANNIANPNMIYAGTEITLSADQTVVTTKDPAGNVQSSQTQAQAPASAAAQTSNAQAYSAPQKSVSSASQSQYRAPQAKQQPAAQPKSSNSGYTSNASGGDAAAKEWIAQRESSGSYSAYNPSGGYYGRYQLNPSLISYGASPSEQEAAADKYVSGRYGSWSNAKSHWEQKGWY